MLESRNERLVTVEELAEVLAVPKSWIYSKTAAKQIPHVKVGHYVRFRVPDVLDWLAETDSPVGR